MQKRIIMDVGPDGEPGPYNLVPQDTTVNQHGEGACSRCKVFGRLLVNWAKMIYRTDDEKLLNMNGFDFFVFLVFQRQIAYILTFVGVFGLVFLMPVYWTGDPLIKSKRVQSINNLNTFTILNVTANNSKIVYTYFVAMFIIPLFVLMGIQ